MDTARERYYVMNTMLCLIKALEGKKTTIELRDEKQVTGKIVNVDGYMNVSMKRVQWKSLTNQKLFDSFFVHGRMIRYVHIPDEIDIKQSMNQVLTAMSGRQQASEGVQREIKDQAWKKMLRNRQAHEKKMRENKDK
ncbi:LSM domain [Mactra antiquata]